MGSNKVPCDGGADAGATSSRRDQLLQGWAACPSSLPPLLALLLVAVGGSGPFPGADHQP